MYTVYVLVKNGSSVVDTINQPLGVRYFKVDANQGFFLNGKPYDLHGVAMHQDRLNEGVAISDADRVEDVGLIKEIGATFVRLAHYQHDQTTYDLLDRAGVVVSTEIPLVNYANDSTTFVDNIKQQLKELIRQNYNHPSVMFWGLFNEIPDNSKSNALIPQLNQLAHDEDSTRLTTGSSFNKVPLTSKLNTYTDVIGVNQYYGWYGGTPDQLGGWEDGVHTTYPTRKQGLSEYGAGASIYQHGLNPSNIVPTGTWHPEEYQSLVHEQTWAVLKSRPYLWEKVVWNMFDFASDLRSEGDTMGRNDKGLVTYDHKTKKDAFYFYKANWSDEKFVYITSRRWTDRTDALTDVKVYSNYDNVALFVNDQFIGTLAAPDHVFIWHDVMLAEGANEIEAIPVADGATTEDRVAWTLTPPPPPPLPDAQPIRLPPPPFPLQFSARNDLKEVLDGQSKEI
jgi:beta-galactosidase